MFPERNTRGLLMIATAVALLLRLWGLTFGLPLTQARPDEDAIVETAARMWSTGPNPHFFDYPTLYIYVVAGAIRAAAAFGVTEPRDLYLLDRVIVALLGTATVPLLFWATRRVLSAEVGLIAAVFLSVAFLHVRDSHFGVTDVPATFMIVLAFGIMARSRLGWSHPWTTVGAGVVCGLAASTKYNAAIVLAPLLIASADHEWAARRRIATVIALMLLVAAGALAGFLLGTPFAVLDYPAFRNGFLFVGAHLARGHGVDLGIGWWRHLTFSLWYGAGWPMLVSGLAGMVIAARMRSRRALLLLTFPLLYYAVIGSGQTVFARYVTPLVPFLCVFAAVTVARVAAWQQPWIAGRRAAFAAAGLAISIIGTNVARTVAFDLLMSAEDNRLVAARALEAGFPAGTTIHQLGAVYAHLTPPSTFRVWTDDPSLSLLDVPPAALPDLVVVPSSPLPTYTEISERAREALRRRYTRIARFDVERAGRTEPLVYDEQDAFFAPFGGFRRLRRPGPTIEIFQRVP